jgi:hypothetical protein
MDDMRLRRSRHIEPPVGDWFISWPPPGLVFPRPPEVGQRLVVARGSTGNFWAMDSPEGVSSVSLPPTPGQWVFRVTDFEGFERYPESGGHGATCRGLVLAEKLPAWRAFGPRGQEVVAVVAEVQSLTPDEVERLADLAPPGAHFDPRTVAGDHRYSAWCEAVREVRRAIALRSPESALDEYKLHVGELRLADPARIALAGVAADAVAEAMFPEAMPPGEGNRARDAWMLLLEHGRATRAPVGREA